MSRTHHHHHRQMTKNGPGWFHHLTTEVPMRAYNRRLEKIATTNPLSQEVNVSRWQKNPRKPNVYWW